MTEVLCQHVTDNHFTKSLQGRKIFKDQCVRCFTQPNHPDGVMVCMKCFNGFCSDHIKAHDGIHNHPLYLRVKNTIKPGEEKKQITKLAVGVKGGAVGQDQYETSYNLWCSRCSKLIPEAEPKLQAQIKSLINTDSPFKKQNLVAWELQIQPCEHTLTLQQDVQNIKLDHCSKCDLSTNLWLCLTCGAVGCGRKNWDGTGGNNHAITHFEESHHPLVVKLGTITAEGSASLYCYSCNNDVKDQFLQDHLRNLGLNVANQKKTQKTVMEINLDINLNFALSKLVEGKDKEEPLYGPGLTGINNIGNTCYMNSVLQVLNGLPEYQQQYYKIGEKHMNECKKLPGDCFHCQVAKIFWGLNSGVYSQKKHKNITINEIECEQEYQEGIKPYDFKILLAKDHPEFTSSRQQDALQYLQWVFDRLDKEEPFIGESTTRYFNYSSVNRLVCGGCNGHKLVEVKTNELKFPVPPPTQEQTQKYYKQLEGLDNQTKKAKLCEDPEYDVKMQDCMNILKQGDAVSVNCPRCNSEKIFMSRNYFKTTPKYLLAVPNRFVLDNWVPKKLNALIDVQEELDISDFLLKNAPKVGDKLEVKENKVQYSEANVNELINMGFSENAAKRALIKNKDNLEGATNWIMENMGNDSINAPIEQASSAKNNADPAAVAQLMDFGFDQTQAKVALLKNGGNIEAAGEWLFTVDGNVTDHLHLLNQGGQKMQEEEPANQGPVHSKYRLKAVVIHLGRSVHSGHYVAYVRTDKGWVLFNDEKVTHSTNPVLGKGYVYLYEGV